LAGCKHIAMGSCSWQVVTLNISMQDPEKISLDDIPIWTQGEMLGALFAGIVIGLAIGLAFRHGFY
jgi:uncharacterized membrane-anchored protein YitT (DUF2179 family)